MWDVCSSEWSSVFYNSFYGQKVSLSELSFSVILLLMTDRVSLWSTVQLSSSLPSLQSSSPSQRNAEGMHWPFLHSSRPWLLQAANTHTHTYCHFWWVIVTRDTAVNQLSAHKLSRFPRSGNHVRQTKAFFTFTIQSFHLYVHLFLLQFHFFSFNWSKDAVFW